MIDSLSIVVPTFHCKDLILICLKSFEKFRPSDLKLKYIVVENSIDTLYKNEVMKISDNIVWVNNVTNLIGSEANAVGVEVGLKHVDDEWVFLSHCDVCINRLFFENMIEKIENGNELIGTSLDTARINAIHISGLLTKTNIVRKVNLYPQYLKGAQGVQGIQVMDVGDEITVYCYQRFIKKYCFGNTVNNKDLISLLPDSFKKFQVDRCIDEKGNVIFLHLGRGIPKTQKIYMKPGRIGLEEWIEFCNKEILNG